MGKSHSYTSDKVTRHFFFESYEKISRTSAALECEILEKEKEKRKLLVKDGGGGKGKQLKK